MKYNRIDSDKKDFAAIRRLPQPMEGDENWQAGQIRVINGRTYRSRKGRWDMSGTPSRDDGGWERVEMEKPKELASMQAQIDALKKQQAKSSAKPKPKPKGDQQIDPVKDSPEISAARKIVDDFQAGQKNKKSPWAQAQDDVSDSSTFGNFNPGGQTSSDEPQKDPQEFADKYKLNLIQSGATTQNNTDFTSRGESVLSSSDILKRDQQLYGNYM